MDQTKKMKRARLLCLALAALLCFTGLTLPGFTASAAEGPTSLGLAAHGLKAYRDGWKYSSGAKGGSDSSGTRYSDCAGLLYAYFSDAGALGNCRGGATSQVNDNCVFSNDISEGIPNIHGLALTMPDYNDPGSGIYGHIGIYVGDNTAADNSDYTYNMRLEPVVGSGRNWSAWHLFDNGMKYPVEGWYELDGKLVHYTNYEYDTNTAIDGVAVGSDGYAIGKDGQPLSAKGSSLEGKLSSKWAPASQVAAYLRTKYSGVDSTYELIYGGPGPDPEIAQDYNGRITGEGVRLRSAASTQSTVVATLSRGTYLDISGEETGEKVASGSKSTDLWYKAATADGQTGYVCSLFVERLAEGFGLNAPVISASGGYVTMSAGTADIYYTLDGTEPSETSTPYVAPLYLTGYTFKAIAVRGGRTSPVTTATVLSNSSVFTDLDADAWYFHPVDRAVAAGIFQGNGNGTFSPNKKITRIQFVTALANLDGVNLDSYSGDTAFTDVKMGDSHMGKAVSWATEQKLISGFGDGTFRPNDPITREQMCLVLAKYAGLKVSETAEPFTDDGKISGWAKDAVYACRGAGLITGMGNNNFSPKGTTTRAQACVVTVNLSEKQPDKQ